MAALFSLAEDKDPRNEMVKEERDRLGLKVAHLETDLSPIWEIQASLYSQDSMTLLLLILGEEQDPEAPNIYITGILYRRSVKINFSSFMTLKL